MSSISAKKNKVLKCGSAIKILSIIALVCAVLGCVPYFYHLGKDLISLRPSFYYFIVLFLSLAPFILFVLYVFKLHNNLNSAILVPLIFGILPLNLSKLGGYGSDSVIYFILDLMMCAACVLAIISALKGFNTKIYIIISIAVCLLREVVCFFSYLSNYMVYVVTLYSVSFLLCIIGTILLYLALLLFGLKNRIPPIISPSSEEEKARVKKMRPEQALEILKDKLDLGIITEDEYKTQRAEIIEKL